MNRNTVEKVAWIVEQSERAFPPAIDLPQYFKSTSGRVRTVNLTMIHIPAFVAAGNRQNSADRAALINNKQHLACEIDFDMSEQK